MNETTSGPDLFNELAHEFAERYRRGERPPLSEYTAKYPELAAEIRELFPALVAVEAFGSAGGGGPPAAGPPPRQLGEYRILREVARGGMGVVYEAVQESLGRHVALKVLPLSAGAAGHQLERFRREAKAAARLHHTNIVPVFGVGEHQGVHYYAMQFIHGQTLASVLEEVKRLRRQGAPTATTEQTARVPAGVAVGLVTGRFPDAGRLGGDAGPEPAVGEPAGDAGGGGTGPPPVGPPSEPGGSMSAISGGSEAQYFRSVARVGLQAAEALAYAHQQGLLHRDIKPSNLLLDTQGTVWVTDFGLAKEEGADDLTSPGDVVGTLRYMAPERFQGQADPRSDVYGLGVTLYEMMTLRPAFDAAERARLIDRVVHQEPVRPRRLDGRIPRDLETVVLKTIRKDPVGRYASASELAEDLRRFLADRPIRARRTSAVEKLWRWCRRNPAVAAMTAALVLTLTLLAGGIGWVARDRAARAAALEEQVNHSLAEARRWQHQGKWRQGQAALQHIELLLTNTDATNPLWTDCRRLRRDLKMLERLEEARLSQTAVKDERFDYRAADFLYREAFEEYDLRVLSLGRQEAARRVASSAIAKELVAALINWGNIAADRATRKKLMAAARLAERDPRRQEFLKALWRRDWPGLVLVGKKRGILDQPPATLALLGEAMALADAPAAVEFLRRAQRRYPGDFWINYQLGRAQWDMKPPRLEEAIGSFRAAVASNPDSPGAHVNLGGAFQDKGELDEAIAEYREAIALKNDYLNPHLTLGWALRKKGLWKEALAECRTAIALKPKLPAAHNNLGLVLYDQGRVAEAIAEFRLALRYNPKYALAHYNLGRAFQEKRQSVKAIAEYQEAIRLKPNYAEAHTNLGNEFLEMGQVDKAIAAFRRALRAKKPFPEAYNAYNGLGNAFVRKGLLDKALTAWQKAVELKADLAVAHNNIGNALASTGRLAEGIAELRKALRIDPKMPEAHYNLGRALKDRGKLDEAIAEYHQATKLKPDYAEAYYDLGIALRARGRRDDAIIAYQQAIRWKPGYAAAHVNLGNILRAKGRLDEALGHFQEAVRSRPNLPQAHACLGSALRQKGRLDDAISQFQEAIRLKPDLPGVHTDLGDLFSSRGRLDEATAQYEAAIRLKPDDADAHSGLGIVLSDGKRDYDRAIAEFQEVIRLKPDSAGAYYCLGITLGRKGRADQAIAALRHGLQLKPDVAAMRCDLAALLRHQGKVDEAVVEYKEAIRRQSDFARAHNDLGAILCDDKGDYDGAILVFRGALRLRPDYALAHAGLGTALQHKGELKDAVAHFQEAIRLKPKEAFGYNGLAWLLANSPDAKFRDPRRAVELALQAVARAPRGATCWNTLGVAHYRAGHWEEAIAGLTKSMALQKGALESFDAFFLAMAHWRLGQKEKARRWYDRAVRWMENNKDRWQGNKQRSEELRRFRTETAELLGLAKKER
jgi:tetratricopeptide (TPR) repeat protein/serine/threonine protein kinase